MKYKFEVRTMLPDEELSDVINSASEGLEASNKLIVELTLNLNTELPDEKVESLQESVSEFISDRLGIEADAKLISKEN